MAIEWKCECKDCGEDFGYSDNSHLASMERGHSRPERCPTCRQQHGREINTIGQPYFKLKPLDPNLDHSKITSVLGRLSHPEREHVSVRNDPPPLDPAKFGITDEGILEMFRKFEDDPRLQVIVVVGPTGSGKSTFLPYRLVVPPVGVKDSEMWHRYGQIVVTQPRIQSTRNIPAFIAKDMIGSSLGSGFDVGFRHAKNPCSDWRSKLVFVTDGTLINWIANGQLDKINTIMIDKAHERSLNIDVIIGLLTRALPRYPRLKLLIASATISSDTFIQHFEKHLPSRYKIIDGEKTKLPNCEFQEFEGKSFEVTPHYRSKAPLPYDERSCISKLAKDAHKHVAEEIVDLLRCMYDFDEGIRIDHADWEVDLTERRGDILGFLHGEKPIEACCKLIREGVALLDGVDVQVLPLYTTLPQEEQDKALLKRPSVHETRIDELVDYVTGIERGVIAIGDILVLHNNADQFREIKRVVRDRLEKSESQLPVEIVGVSSADIKIEGGRLPQTPPGGICIVLATDRARKLGLVETEQFAHVLEQESETRTVTISTNVAETSLTIHGILHVVDSGFVNQNVWNETACTEDVGAILQSRAGCKQRWGRAGRLQAGDAWTLYTQEQFGEDDSEEVTKPTGCFPFYSLPEIERSSLEQVILTAKAAGVDDLDPDRFPWMEPTESDAREAFRSRMRGELKRSKESLVQKRALDKSGDLTEHGLELGQMMESARLGNLLVVADRLSCAVEMSALLPLVSSGIARLLVRNHEWDDATKGAIESVHANLKKLCRDDLEFGLKVYAGWSEAAEAGNALAEIFRWEEAWRGEATQAVRLEGFANLVFDHLDDLDYCESLKSYFAGLGADNSALEAFESLLNGGSLEEPRDDVIQTLKTVLSIVPNNLLKGPSEQPLGQYLHEAANVETFEEADRLAKKFQQSSGIDREWLFKTRSIVQRGVRLRKLWREVQPRWRVLVGSWAWPSAFNAWALRETRQEVIASELIEATAGLESAAVCLGAILSKIGDETRRSALRTVLKPLADEIFVEQNEANRATIANRIAKELREDACAPAPDSDYGRFEALAEGIIDLESLNNLVDAFPGPAFEVWRERVIEAIPKAASLCWSRLNFVEDRQLRDKVEPARQAFIESLSGHTKGDEQRRIDFGLVDRLRLIFAFCLPDHCYVRTGNEEASTGNYRALMDTLGEDGTSKIAVSMDNGSVCQGEELPVFVCASRRTISRPDQDPTISASFVLRMDEEWIPTILGEGESPPLHSWSVLELVRFAANSGPTDPAERAAWGNQIRHRLFIDQDLPLNSTCPVLIKASEGNGWRAQVFSPVVLPPPIFERTRSASELDSDPEIQISEGGDGLSATIVTNLEAAPVIDPEAIEKEVSPINDSVFAAEADEMELQKREDLQCILEPDKDSQEDEFAGEKREEAADSDWTPRRLLELEPERDEGIEGIVTVLDRVEPGDRIEAEVTGFEVDQHGEVWPILSSPGNQVAFPKFRKEHVEGDEIIVRIEGIDRTGQRPALKVVEPLSGLKTVMQCTDLSFAQTDAIVEVVHKASGNGAELRVVVSEIDDDAGRIRLTTHRFGEEAISALLRGESASGFVADLGGAFIPVILHDSRLKEGVAICVGVNSDNLPSVELGDEVELGLQTWKKKSFDYSFSTDPRDLPSRIRWDSGQSRLIVDKRVTWVEAATILNERLDGSLQFRRAVRQLYEQSNRLRGMPQDLLTAFRELNGRKLTARVVEVKDAGADVMLERGSDSEVGAWLPAHEYDWVQTGTIQEKVQSGDTFEVIVFEVEIGSVKVSRKQTIPGPADKYVPGSLCRGRVVNVLEKGIGIHAELESNVRGFCYINELAFKNESDTARDFCVEGDELVFQVLPARDSGGDDIQLSHKMVLKELIKSIPDQPILAKVIGFNDPWLDVELAPRVRARIHINEFCLKNIKDIKDIVQELNGQDQIAVELLGFEDRGFLQLSGKSVVEMALKMQEGYQFSGQVTGTTSFGAFVSIAPGVVGLCHISELANHRVGSVEEICQRGDRVSVVLLSSSPNKKDKKKLDISLSIKDLQGSELVGNLDYATQANLHWPNGGSDLESLIKSGLLKFEERLVTPVTDKFASDEAAKSRSEESSEELNQGPFSLTCEHCDTLLKVPASLAGVDCKCPICEGVISVPTLERLQSIQGD